MSIVSEHIINIAILGVFIFGNIFILLTHAIRKEDEPLKVYHLFVSFLVTMMVVGAGIFIPLSFYFH
jgi:hypothetical protein